MTNENNSTTDTTTKTSGVYCIRNITNNKRYVGSSTDVAGRWQVGHRNKLRRGTHTNEYLQRAWVKYGEANFVFELLEEVEPATLLLREAYWIAHYSTHLRRNGYNIRNVEENGLQTHAAESIEKNRLAHIGKRHTDITKQILRLQQLAKPKSAVARAKMSAAKLGTKRSPETIEKHRAAICKTVYDLTNIYTGQRFIGYNLSKFARDNGLYVSNAWNVVKGNRQSCGGWFSTAALAATRGFELTP